jgi:multidrug efflux pump subunit AcrB
MLATGIKTPVGVKVSGTNLQEIDRIASEVEHAVKKVLGVTFAFAERLTGGRYIDVNINSARADRYGLNIADVRSHSTSLISADGGFNLSDRWRVQAEVFNVLNRKSSGIDYYYASRLPGEPPNGVNDIHFHPVEPISFRVGVAWKF